MRIDRTAVTALLVAGLGGQALAAGDTQVYLYAGELNYVGPLTAEANGKLQALYQQQADKPTVLAIRSGGGDTSAGMALGSWVRERQLTVKVLELCFSSCANYVFTAAPARLVSNFSVVGYHGGVASTRFHPGAAEEKALAALPPAQREQARAAMSAAFQRAIAADVEKETQYFRAIGVQQSITSLGQAERYDKLYGDDDHTIGWYYDLDGLKKLGVGQVTVINPPWRPRFLTGKNTVFKLEVD